MWGFISKIKWTYLLIIGLAAFSFWAWDQIQFQKSEKNRMNDNYENLRDQDSLKISQLVFRTNKEIQDYIDSNNDLEELIYDQNIKIRKLNKIIYQKQTYIDTFTRKTNVSQIIKYIREDVESVSKWTDSTECLVIKGDVTYKNDSLMVNVNKREFRNKIAITGSWERNKWSFLGLWEWRLFGRKKATAKATSKCGESETIIIERKK